MKPSFLVRPALALGLALLSIPSVHAQHGHLNVGAASTAQNAALLWANGADFAVSSGYVKTLEYTNAGRYAGYFQGGITLTALPATAANAGPDPQAPALGAYVQFRMSCLEGPAGGAFQFWESTGATPALSLTPGQISTNLWRLSQGDGSPGSDPYGHIHGRRFSATKAGLYKVGFTAVDTSINGAGGGPIHQPSPEMAVWFQAGVCIAQVEPDYEEGHVHIRFGAAAGYTWQIQASTQLGPAAMWMPAGAPVIGADTFVEVVHEAPPGEQRFYRALGTPSSP